MTTLEPLYQGQGFRGSYVLFENDKTTPISLEGRDMEIKLINVQNDCVDLTIADANITKTSNIAAFTVAGSLTTSLEGEYKVQIYVEGVDVTDNIYNITEEIITYLKRY